MKFDFIYFDSGGTLYNPKADTDITPMQVFAEGAQRVHSLLLGFDLDLASMKPDPAIFRLAEKLGGLEGKRVLYVGNDLEADIKGASAIGWSTAFRRADNQSSGGLADMEFDDIMDVVKYCLD
ncbi:MAG: HAD hydrolase-like protein [Verrucomicrobia bacterium]|nr:HAD hydrolase-like protein [Verrucomicrobiota bacterium]MCH8510370.1 HAD hydrolase-like protein [Kiritimatiellia bacterium]